MNQNWVVGLVVGLAALYCVWYVLPRAVRQRLGRLHHVLGRAPSCSPSCDRCGKCPGSAAAAPDAANQTHPIHFPHKG